MMRAVFVDHSEAYRRFRNAAAQDGYEKAPPEDVHLYDKVTVTVASDASAKKTFFDTATGVLTNKTQDPLVRNQQPLPNDISICIYACGLEVEQQLYAGTLTESAAVLSYVGDSVLTIYQNSDRILEWRGSNCTFGRPGEQNTTDTATSAAQVKTSIDRLAGMEPLAIPKVIPGGSQIRAELQLPASLAGTNDNFTVALHLGIWVVRKGAPPPDRLLSARL